MRRARIRHRFASGTQPIGNHRVEGFGGTLIPCDRVVQLDSDYERETSNGDIGTVAGHGADGGELAATFDASKIAFGLTKLDAPASVNAVTMGKSRGGEYTVLVNLVLTQHDAMLRWNLLYTGIICGSRRLLLVGQRKVVGIALHAVAGLRRRSKLGKCLATASRAGSAPLARLA